jgi:hypothetical protein
MHGAVRPVARTAVAGKRAAVRVASALLLAALGLPAPSGRGAGPLAAEEGAHDIADLRWLAGCWERHGAENHTIEQWTAPRGGMMLGLSQTLRGSETVAWEFLRINSVRDRLLLTAHPSGQPEAMFAAFEMTGSSVVFANPEHDFPQTISYIKQPDGSLLGRIEGIDGGKERRIDYSFTRVPCDGGAP